MLALVTNIVDVLQKRNTYSLCKDLKENLIITGRERKTRTGQSLGPPAVVMMGSVVKLLILIPLAGCISVGKLS